MAETIMITSKDASTRKFNQRLTTENNYYLRMIETLANDMLTFFRDKELHEVQKRNKSKRIKQDVDTRIKRKIPKKAVRTPVVVNDTTKRLNEFIVNELKGTDVTLVIQKTLYYSDTSKSQNRLNMPVNQLETEEFLTANERHMLGQKENKIEVCLVGPTLEMYKMKMELTLWHMASTNNYVLKTHWHQFWLDNKRYLEQDSKIQVWSFRRGQELCFAVVCVEKPGGEQDV